MSVKLLLNISSTTDLYLCISFLFIIIELLVLAVHSVVPCLHLSYLIVCSLHSGRLVPFKGLIEVKRLVFSCTHQGELAYAGFERLFRDIIYE